MVQAFVKKLLSTYKKSLTLSFIVFAVCAFVFKAGEAKAQFVPVLDSANLAQNSITAANTSAVTQKELVLDGIVTAAAKIVISNMTNSIVTWINSGFQGNPAFITNPESFFTDVADQIAGNFIAGTELGFLCEPFSLDIRIALAANYSSTYRQANYCRLSDVVSNTENFAKFTEGDFSRGGWDSWFEISQNPQNNPMGAYLSAQTELSIRTARGQSIKLLEANWGQGFLSYQECLAEDINGNCVEKGPIQTPGSVIESQLENTLGTGVRQLEIADEINEIVSALVGQLVQTVFTEGLSSFSSSGSNYNSLRSSAAAPVSTLRVTCSADRTNVAVGDTVTWRAYVYGGVGGGSTTYLWSGNGEVDGATGDTVEVVYIEAGTRRASVRATKAGQNTFQACSNSVTVQ